MKKANCTATGWIFALSAVVFSILISVRHVQTTLMVEMSDTIDSLNTEEIKHDGVATGDLSLDSRIVGDVAEVSLGVA